MAGPRTACCQPQGRRHAGLDGSCDGGVPTFPDSGKLDIVFPVDRSLGFVAIQPRSGTITVPVEARRALRLDSPGAQVEVILRDHDLLLIPHIAVPLGQMPDDRGAQQR